MNRGISFTHVVLLLINGGRVGHSAKRTGATGQLPGTVTPGTCLYQPYSGTELMLKSLKSTQGDWG